MKKKTPSEHTLLECTFWNALLSKKFTNSPRGQYIHRFRVYYVYAHIYIYIWKRLVSTRQVSFLYGIYILYTYIKRVYNVARRTAYGSIPPRGVKTRVHTKCFLIADAQRNIWNSGGPFADIYQRLVCAQFFCSACFVNGRDVFARFRKPDSTWYEVFFS